MVKRIGNLWEKVISPENLREAARRACQGRRKIADVEKFLSDRDANLERIRTMLIDGTYRTSDYRFFDRREGGKIRHIAALPFYPDRIVHWALILATQDVFLRNLVRRTYAAIPGRGTHDALTDLRRALRDKRFTHYLKVDVHHYFESIDKSILMEKIKRRIKDRRVLDLFEHVIFDYPRDGIPIGNLTSQYFANLYLSDLDHQLAERYHAIAFRYMDDIIVLGWSRSWLRRVRTFMGTELAEIGLEMNPNWRVASVEGGVDFVGYVVFRDFVLLRKRTKTRLKRKMRKLMKAEGEPSIPMRSCVASYHGILSWCDGTRLHRMYVDPVLDKWR